MDFLAEQFDEDFIRDAEFFGREADEVAAAFDESSGFERRKFCAQGRCVGGIEFVEIDAGELAEAEEHFLFVGLVDCYGFELFDRKFPGLDRGYVLS
jgi:hypothetical protein